MSYEWHDIVGNIGVSFIIGTYILLQLERMDSESYLYSILNALGAFFVIISLTYDFNLSGIIVESFWVGISLVGLIRQWRLRHRPT
ncbi:MAG: hypothetical protein OXC42_04940 [Gammaproteobacteria bacterium]|nr:hypothetical protein [Gammaproteobacteria bacterium]